MTAGPTTSSWFGGGLLGILFGESWKTYLVIALVLVVVAVLLIRR